MNIIPRRMADTGSLMKRRGDPIMHSDWNSLVEAAHPVRAFRGTRTRVQEDYDRTDFTWYMIAEDEIRVRAGYFSIAGYLDVRVAETDVALTGNPEYVFLQYQWGAATATVEHSSTLPVTNATYYRHRLCKLSPTAGVYFVDERYHRGGSICLASPLRGGT